MGINKLLIYAFSETEISLCGMNAKLNEVQAAFGLASLPKVDESIRARARVAKLYDKAFSKVAGIKILHRENNIELNHSYYPILVEQEKFGITRDKLLAKLQEENIFARRYFYPLITEFDLYKRYNGLTPLASGISKRVLCLPIHAELTLAEQEIVISTVLLSRGTEKE